MTTATTLTWAQVCARRLARHGLATPWADADPAAVARAVSGVHAQVMSAAEVSIGVRLAGATRADVRAALWDDHSLVKTVGPRGTLHLLASADLAQWTGALALVTTGADSHPDDAQFSAEQTAQLVAAIDSVLGDAELTADELSEALVDATGRWAVEPRIEGFQQRWPRWRLALHPAARAGVLCYGPNRGRAVTYTNPRRWLPGLEPAAPDVALAWLVRRFLDAYGPATPAHFARWLSVSAGRARDAFEALGDALEPVAVDGATTWVNAGDVAAPAEPPRGVRLLPYFDAYGIGCQPRERVFPGRAAQRALARGQAGNYPLLLIDGVVGGVWHQRRSGRRIDVTVEPLGALSRAQRDAAAAEAERVAAIMEGSARVAFGAISVGPHA